MSPETQQLSVIRELHLGSTYLSSTMKRNIFNSILARFSNFRLFSIQGVTRVTPYKTLHKIKKNLYATSINHYLDFGLIILKILQAHYKNQIPHDIADFLITNPHKILD